MTSAVCRSVTSTVAHTMTNTMIGYMALAVTPDWDWNSARRRSTATSDAWPLRRVGAGGRRSTHIWGLGRDDWFGSHFWRNYV